MTPPARARMLIVDDDPDVREVIELTTLSDVPENPTQTRAPNASHIRSGRRFRGRVAKGVLVITVTTTVGTVAGIGVLGYRSIRSTGGRPSERGGAILEGPRSIRGSSSLRSAASPLATSASAESAWMW